MRKVVIIILSMLTQVGMAQDIKDVETAGNGQLYINIVFGVLIVLLFVGAAFMLWIGKKEIDALNSKVDELNANSKKPEEQVSENTAINAVVPTGNVSNQAVSRIENKKEGKDKKTASGKDNLARSIPKPADVVKYGDFYGQNNNMEVANRDLADSPSSGLFKIIIHGNGETAHYTINENLLSAILEDVLALSRVAEIGNIPANFTTIKVIKDGELKREGARWKIVKKMSVQLH